MLHWPLAKIEVDLFLSPATKRNLSTLDSSLGSLMIMPADLARSNTESVPARPLK